MLFTLFTMLNHHGKNANKPPAIAAEEGTRGCNKGCKKKSILSDRFFVQMKQIHHLKLSSKSLALLTVLII